MTKILTFVGAIICFILGTLLVLGVLLGERQYLIGVPGYFALGIILYRESQSPTSGADTP